MTDVFVSYASEDRERVRPIAEALVHKGFSVWWDRRIVAGQQFDRAIEQALDAAKCVVVCWSMHSIASEWVKNEAAVGAERNALVPLLLDDVRIPLEFRRRQTVSLVDWGGDETHAGFAGLCEGIRAALFGDAAHVRVATQDETLRAAVQAGAREAMGAAAPGDDGRHGGRRADGSAEAGTRSVGRGPRVRYGAMFAGVVVLGIVIAVYVTLQRAGDDTGDPVVERVPRAQRAPVTAQVVLDGTTTSHGVFTPSGKVLAMAHGVGSERRGTLEVVWQADGQTRRSTAKVSAHAALADGVVLLELRSAPGRRFPFPVRIAATLQPGDKVVRYLSESDRAPGSVKQVFGEMTVHGAEGPMKLDRLLVTTMIAGPGDSGAPVLDAGGSVVGLVIAASQTETASIMIEDVKASLPEAFN